MELPPDPRLPVAPLQFAPRHYQRTLFDHAVSQNTIAYLETGSGKTFIASMLIQHAVNEGWIGRVDVTRHVTGMNAKSLCQSLLMDCLEQSMESTEEKRNPHLFIYRIVQQLIDTLPVEQSPKRAIFLVNTQALVVQQSRFLAASLFPLRVGAYTGGNINFMQQRRSQQSKELKLWSPARWRSILQRHSVLCMTAQILLDGLRHGFLSLKDIGLFIFDECHHARGGHPYRILMHEFYHAAKRENSPLPRVLGLTASPVHLGMQRMNAVEREFLEKAFAALEKCLDSKIVTFSKDENNENVENEEKTNDLNLTSSNVNNDNSGNISNNSNNVDNSSYSFVQDQATTEHVLFYQRSLLEKQLLHRFFHLLVYTHSQFPSLDANATSLLSKWSNDLLAVAESVGTLGVYLVLKERNNSLKSLKMKNKKRATEEFDMMDEMRKLFCLDSEEKKIKENVQSENTEQINEETIEESENKPENIDENSENLNEVLPVNLDVDDGLELVDNEEDKENESQNNENNENVNEKDNEKNEKSNETNETNENNEKSNENNELSNAELLYQANLLLFQQFQSDPLFSLLQFHDRPFPSKLDEFITVQCMKCIECLLEDVEKCKKQFMKDNENETLNGDVEMKDNTTNETCDIPPSYRAMIFVHRRITAHAMTLVLSHFLPNSLPIVTLVGRAASASSSDSHFSHARNALLQHRVTMQRFHSGDAKILVATSVAEEGIDVRACRLVLRYDLPMTVTAYIQSRGRARQPGSVYILFMEQNSSNAALPAWIPSSCLSNQLPDADCLPPFVQVMPVKKGLSNQSEWLVKVKQFEQSVQSMALLRGDENESDNEDETENEDNQQVSNAPFFSLLDFVSVKISSTEATLTLRGATGILFRFAQAFHQSLFKDQGHSSASATLSGPEKQQLKQKQKPLLYHFTSLQSPLFHCHITFPYNFGLNLPGVVGMSKGLAKKQAAFEMCIALRILGLLDTYWMPNVGDWIKTKIIDKGEEIKAPWQIKKEKVMDLFPKIPEWIENVEKIEVATNFDKNMTLNITTMASTNNSFSNSSNSSTLSPREIPKYPFYIYSILLNHVNPSNTPISFTLLTRHPLPTFLDHFTHTFPCIHGKSWQIELNFMGRDCLNEIENEVMQIFDKRVWQQIMGRRGREENEKSGFYVSLSKQNKDEAVTLKQGIDWQEMRNILRSKKKVATENTTASLSSASTDSKPSLFFSKLDPMKRILVPIEVGSNGPFTSNYSQYKKLNHCLSSLTRGHTWFKLSNYSALARFWISCQKKSLLEGMETENDHVDWKQINVKVCWKWKYSCPCEQVLNELEVLLKSLFPRKFSNSSVEKDEKEQVKLSTREKRAVLKHFHLEQQLQPLTLNFNLWKVTSLLPEVIDLLVRVSLASECYDELMKCREMSLSTLPSSHLEALSQALTFASAARQPGADLERFEFLGDAFLKTIITQQLYLRYPQADQGHLSFIKSKLVSNQWLFQCAQRQRLAQFITTQPMQKVIGPGHHLNYYYKITNEFWQVQCPVSQKKESQFLDKAWANSLESVLGWVAWNEMKLSGDEKVFESVQQIALNYFKIVPPLDDEIAMPILADEITLTLEEQSKVDYIQSLLGYTFKQPKLLYHVLHCETPIGQRLEFLGDAVLDTNIALDLYFHFPLAGPDLLTRFRSSMVNNRFLAHLCLQHQLLLDSVPFQEGEHFLFDKKWADLVESLIGAVYVDNAYDLRGSWQYLKHWWKEAIQESERDWQMHELLLNEMTAANENGVENGSNMLSHHNTIFSQLQGAKATSSLALLRHVLWKRFSCRHALTFSFQLGEPLSNSLTDPLPLERQWYRYFCSDSEEDNLDDKKASYSSFQGVVQLHGVQWCKGPWKWTRTEAREAVALEILKKLDRELNGEVENEKKDDNGNENNENKVENEENNENADKSNDNRMDSNDTSKDKSNDENKANNENKDSNNLTKESIEFSCQSGNEFVRKVCTCHLKPTSFTNENESQAVQQESNTFNLPDFEKVVHVEIQTGMEY